MQKPVSFIRDRNGNFAIIFSFMVVPLMLGVGLAVDYSNLLRVRQELQIAADSAAIAVSQKGDTLGKKDAKVLGDKFVDGNFDPTYTKFKLRRKGDLVIVDAKTKVPFNFMGLLGMKEMTVSVHSSAEISTVSYEIALALDTTGSMAGGKLASMKDAVNRMVDNLEAQNPNNGSLKFSVVPFSSMVNVGPEFGPQFNKGNGISQQPAAWLDDLAKSPVSQSDLDPGVSRFALYRHLNMSWPGCVETRPVANGIDFGTNDVEPDRNKPETLFVPAFASDERDNEVGPNNYLPDRGAGIGTGSVTDRMSRYGASYAPAFKSLPLMGQIGSSNSWVNRSPDYSVQNYYGNYPVNKGPDFGCDVQPIMPLTTNGSAVKSKVNSLVALGSTNITEGAMWGWRTLSARPPFTEASNSKGSSVKKIMVLLTDGTNSFGVIPNSMGSAYTSFGYLRDGRLGLNSGTDAEVTQAMNVKTLAACSNAKADGIEIYTIRLEEPNVTTGDLLRKCASDDSHYLDVPNRSMLDEAFKQIAKKITLVRLAS